MSQSLYIKKFTHFLEESATYYGLLQESAATNAGGVIHEILTGYYLNGGKKDNAHKPDTHMSKHEDIDGLSPHEAYHKYKEALSPEQLDEAHKYGNHAAQYIRENLSKDGHDIGEAHWTSKHGDIERSTGIKSSQKEDPSDIVVTTKQGKHVGVSLKRSSSTRNVPLLNPGIESIHGGSDILAEHRKNIKTAIPELSGLKSAKERKAYVRANPEIEEKTRSMNRDTLSKMATGAADHLNSLPPAELSKHIRDNVLHAHATPMQNLGHDHMRVVTWGSKAGAQTAHVDPGKMYEHILENPHHILARSTGQGIGFYVPHPKTGKEIKFANQSIKFDSQADPMSSVKSATVDNFNSVGEIGEFLKRPSTPDASGKKPVSDHTIGGKSFYGPDERSK